MSETRKLKSVGILGGTFDPPHWGHLRLAEHFCKILHLDHIIWMPAGQPWQKPETITPAKHRLAMSEYAIETLRDLFVDHHIYTKIEISTLEMARSGPSYAIDTAQEIRALYGKQTSITWLMGWDSWENLHTWKEWEKLTEQVHLAVTSRPANSSKAFVEEHFSKHITTDPALLQLIPHGKVLLDQGLQINLSSTRLRELLINQPSADELADAIPPLVLEYIHNQGLYR